MSFGPDFATHHASASGIASTTVPDGRLSGLLHLGGVKTMGRVASSHPAVAVAGGKAGCAGQLQRTRIPLFQVPRIAGSPVISTPASAAVQRFHRKRYPPEAGPASSQSEVGRPPSPVPQAPVPVRTASVLSGLMRRARTWPSAGHS